jgi:hypothetical protein
MEQPPATQAATPLRSAGHAVQEAPQADGSSRRAQAPPQAWNPVLHTNPHLVPSQVACDAPVGTEHTMHDGPQPVTSETARQKPLQACVPVGQSKEQLVPGATQVPLHRVFPVGHLPPHEVPSQVAEPFCGTGHGEQAGPQLLGSSFRTHFPPHECWPDSQTAASTSLSTPPSSLPLAPGASGTSPPDLVSLDRTVSPEASSAVTVRSHADFSKLQVKPGRQFGTSVVQTLQFLFKPQPSPRTRARTSTTTRGIRTCLFIICGVLGCGLRKLLGKTIIVNLRTIVVVSWHVKRPLLAQRSLITRLRTRLRTQKGPQGFVHAALSIYRY